MEMPNVSPATTTQAALDNKYAIAQRHSAANYAFYLGATESNIEDIKALDPEKTCGVKVFMGASTGNLLVENPTALEAIFRDSPVTILTHCESGPVILKNLTEVQSKGTPPTITDHPIIRDANACYQSSSYAVDLAKKYQSNLHVLHITTERELSLFSPGPIDGKRITAEACVHHLWFSDKDYPRLGNLIKCNPAIKAESDRNALINAVNTGLIDIIATDHAPHTWQEKNQDYNQAPAGLPLVQHALLSLLDHVKQGNFTIKQVVEKVAHNPAKRFNVVDRGFIREGYFADLVLVNTDQSTTVTHDNTFYKCQWSPFVDHAFSSRILSTWVNGDIVFDGNNTINTFTTGLPLRFNR
jgi:dihydroorotase